MDDIKGNLDNYYYDIDSETRLKSKEVSEWIHRQRALDKISSDNSKRRNSSGHHPITILQ